VESRYEGGEVGFVRGIDFDDEAASGVEGDAGQGEAIRQLFDEGAEADSLDYAFQNDAMTRRASALNRYRAVSTLLFARA
jgi:hypothetical protein